MKTLDRLNAHFIQNHGDRRMDGLMLLLLASSIIGFLSVRSMTNTCFFILLALILAQLKPVAAHARAMKFTRLEKLIFISLCMPVAALVISQGLRNDWIAKAYDGPSRMLLSILILVYVLHKKLDFAKIVEVTAPISLWILVFVTYAFPGDLTAITGGRLTTYFVDPNAYGTYTLVLTAFCIFSVDLKKKTALENAVQILSALIGFYMVAGSGTRGAWVAIPVLLVLWAFLKTQHPFKIVTAVAITLTGLMLIAAHINAGSGSDTNRLTRVPYEFMAWINGNDPNTAAGIRLTFWKMSWELFKHNPLIGYGDTGFRAYLNEPWIANIANERARQEIFNGPHNEFLANLLRSGVWGGLSVIGLFFVPFAYFWQHRKHPSCSKAAHYGMAFLACTAVCSLSSEVFTLKYTATFYGLVISGLVAQFLWNGQANNSAQGIHNVVH